MVYKFKPGSRISADPEVAVKELNRLAAEGRLNAETLVDVSRPEDAPLHNEFEWRDDVAAEEWRKQQARCLINCLVIVDDEKSLEPVRAYVHINESTSNYEPIQKVLCSIDGTEALKRMCFKELTAFQNKYRNVLAMIDANEKVDAIRAELQDFAV